MDISSYNRKNSDYSNMTFFSHNLKEKPAKTLLNASDWILNSVGNESSLATSDTVIAADRTGLSNCNRFKSFPDSSFLLQQHQLSHQSAGTSQTDGSKPKQRPHNLKVKKQVNKLFNLSNGGKCF
jgi:hypothetical protein